VQGRHTELLKRWEDLQAKMRLDPVTDGVQFRRIEPPFAAAEPAGPNRPMMLAGVLVAAIGAALAAAFVLSELNPVFFTRPALSRRVDIPVLGSITMILTPDAVAKRRRETVVWATACIVLLVSTGGVVLFASQGSTLLRHLLGAQA
jgi:hypothetical protein